MHRPRRATKIRRWSGPVLIVFSALSFVIAMVSPAAGVGPSVAVSPNTGLTNGQTVSVSGSGFSPPAAPFNLAIVIQCNNDPNQPTVVVQAGSPAVPVGCTNPFNALFTFNPDGSLPPTNFGVHTGTVGPPAAGTD